MPSIIKLDKRKPTAIESKSTKVSEGQSCFSAYASSLKCVCIYLQITMPSSVLCAMAVNSPLRLETGFLKLWATLGMTLALYAQ